MDAAAHNPAFAKKVGIPVKVAKEFSKASKGQTFKKGGEMKESKAMMGKEVAFMKKKGAPKSMLKHEMAEMKSEGRGMAKANLQKKGMKGYKAGGIATSLKAHAAAPASKAHAKKMASGGLAAGHKTADGVATKGKTKGKEVAMKKGGMCK